MNEHVFITGPNAIFLMRLVVDMVVCSRCCVIVLVLDSLSTVQFYGSLLSVLR